MYATGRQAESKTAESYITFNPASGTLPPGGSATVTITLACPHTLHVAGHVVCTCPHQPPAAVAIHGDVIKPRLALTHCVIPLGVTYVGRHVCTTLELINLTCLDTTYHVLAPTHTSIEAHVPEPEHVLPDSSRTLVHVEVVPTHAGNISAYGGILVNGGETVVGYEVRMEARDLAVAVALVPPRDLAGLKGILERARGRVEGWAAA